MAEELTELEQQVYDFMLRSPHVTIAEIMGEFDLGYEETMNILKTIRLVHKINNQKYVQEGQ